MGYLDNAGLAHLWGKIKGYVSTPTKILTQAEYNALTEAEKQANILYAITDDGGSSEGGASAGEVYSTEEQRIGTWIDGKPIYQRVVSGVVRSSTGNLISVTGETSEIDTVLRLDTKLIPKGSAYIYFGTSFHESTSTWFDTFSREGNVLINCGPTFNECTATVIVEYTKTTDPATIELPAVLSTPTTETTAGTDHAEEV